MVFSGYLIAAINKVAGERLSKFWHFVSGNVPVFGITQAQADAGYTIIPANVYTEQLMITGFRIKVNTAGIGTANLLIQTTESPTPTVIASIPNAALTSGAVVTPATANVTLTNFCKKLNPGVGIQIKTSTTSTGSYTLDVIPLEFSAR